MTISASTTAKYFISDKTYDNLLRMIGGFCGYVKCILAYSDAEIFVPGLHSNQSSVEGLFSRIRGVDRDMTDL